MRPIVHTTAVDQLLMSISQAAKTLNVSRSTVRRLLGQGLEDRRVFRRRLVVAASVKHFAEGSQ